MSSFSFSFAGDDIEDTDEGPAITLSPPHNNFAAETGSLRRPSNTAFPVTGRPLLPAITHSLDSLLASLPSKIAYSTLKVKLDDGSEIGIARRELWDVRLQLMAEAEVDGSADAALAAGLGKDDVKTGVYEGGFKSWESSVDLVKVLAARNTNGSDTARRVLELGCGTALPSLAVLQWQLAEQHPAPLYLSFADYNPTVLQLVTVPNILLAWAQSEAAIPWEDEAELDIDESVLLSFKKSLLQRNFTLSFFSGAWGPEFITHIVADSKQVSAQSSLLVLGAETIYSPVALNSFAETLMAILHLENGKGAALVGAKKVYFGVGGSIEDFCERVRERGAAVAQIREEEDGVRRAVVEVNVAKIG